MTAEHIHLAINHLPIIGMACAIIPLLTGLFGRNRPALAAGLLLALVSGLSVFAVIGSGEAAAERYEAPDRHGIAVDAGAHEWMEAHEEDAEFFAPVMYTAAGFAAIGLLLCLIRSGWAFAVGWLVLVLAAASAATAILIADSGGKIRRPDFRAHTAAWSVTGSCRFGAGDISRSRHAEGQSASISMR